MNTTQEPLVPSSQPGSNRASTATYKLLAPVLEGLRHMSLVEMRGIDKAAGQAKEKAKPLVDQVVRQFKQAATQAIIAAPVAITDLEQVNNDIFIAKLNRRVCRVLQEASQNLAEKHQLEIQREVLAILDSLYALAVTVDQMAWQLQLQIKRQEAGPFGGSHLPTDEVTLQSSMVATLNKLWSEYNEVETAYDDNGSVTHIGAIFAAGILSGAFGLPVISAAVLDIKPDTLFPNGTSVEEDSAPNRIKHFKNSYRQAVLTIVEQELKARRSETIRKVEAHILNSYENLKREIEALLDQAEQRLNELSGFQTNAEGRQHAT